MEWLRLETGVRPLGMEGRVTASDPRSMADRMGPACLTTSPPGVDSAGYRRKTETGAQLPVVHLHLHTHFSFGSGVSSPDVLAAAAAERGHRALACTDTNGVYGVIEFQRACDAVGVRPI